MENANTNKEAKIGKIQPASTSSQSHFPIPDDFCMYSTEHIAIKTAASDKTVQVMAIAPSCIFVIPKIESKHDKQHEATNIRAIQIINPDLRCDILLLSFNQSITFIDYYFICST